MRKIIGVVVCILCFVSVFMLSSCSSEQKELKSVKISGYEIKCDMDMKQVLEAYKDLEYEYSESISCAYSGMDKIYDFSSSGFVVSTYPDGDRDRVLEVSINKEGIDQMGKKVYVGMPQTDVVSLFGEDYTRDGDVMTYHIKNTEKQTMYFLITDGKVEEYGISVAE